VLSLKRAKKEFLQHFAHQTTFVEPKCLSTHQLEDSEFFV